MLVRGSRGQVPRKFDRSALLTCTTATSASSSSALTAAAGIDARATPTASAVVARPASARTSWTTAPVVARSGAYPSLSAGGAAKQSSL